MQLDMKYGRPHTERSLLLPPRAWLCGALILSVAACTPGKPEAEVTAHTAEGLGSNDAGTSDANAGGGALTPSACIVARGSLQIGDRSTYQGDIAAGSITLGMDSKYTGNVFSAGNVTIGDRTTITGTLAYAGTLADDATVTIGSLDKTAVSTPVIASETIAIGTTVVNVANGGSQTIAPGAYAAVTVGFGAHATFSAGIYRMASLLVDSGATVTLNTTGGPIILRVQGSVTWQAGAVTANDFTKVGLYSNGATVQLLDGLTFPGSISAPKAALTLNTGVTVQGCLAANSISMEEGATITASSNPCSAQADGATCKGANLCEQAYTCQSGVCTGSNPVTCTASDQCHAAGTCNTSTGQCSNSVVTNGTTCSDGNACTQTDSCQNGVCTGSNPVTCTASDQCHAAGTCNTSTGQCSNPVVTNGTTCSDGNACTQTDSCQNGVCTGSNPVTCTASDQCHAAGTCNTSTGQCSNPVVTNGTTCSDGNACTQTDSCQNGVCTGSNPVTCTASDQCHAAGACNTSTGQCSNPVATNGTTCSDGNACTQTDSCQNGVCTGSNPVTCTASDQCHAAGTCNTSTGQCSNPVATNGTTCSDGNACTQTDSCQNGVCTGSNPVTCTASDQCHAAGTCNTSTGQCSNPVATNGTTCSDGNACTQTDSCQNGVCTGSNPVTCTASDQCHAAGACNPSTGQCSNPVAANGMTCSDNNACTQSDACQNGVCTGSPVTCSTPSVYSFQVGSTMSTSRTLHGATRLTTGDVLVTGGFGTNGSVLSTAQIFEASTGTWSATMAMPSAVDSQPSAVDSHAATLLPSGRVLIAGGSVAFGYEPKGGRGFFFVPPAPGFGIFQAPGALLQDGRVLVGMGIDPNGNQVTVLYSEADSWSEFPYQNPEVYPPGVGPGGVFVVLGNGQVLAVGGSGGPGIEFLPPPSNDAGLFDPKTNAWTAVAPMPAAVTSVVGAPLPNGDALVAGGTGLSGPTAQAYRFSASTGQWSSAGNMTAARTSAAAVVLGDGRVLVVGGEATGGDIYDPTSGRWTAVLSTTPARAGNTATLTGTGTVLVTGGTGDCGAVDLASVDLVVPTGPSPCYQAACDPSAGCVNHPAPDGTACNDGNACTQADVCTQGSCGGTPITCGTGCITGICDPTSGACVADPETSSCSVIGSPPGDPSLSGAVSEALSLCAGGGELSEAPSQASGANVGFVASSSPLGQDVCSASPLVQQAAAGVVLGLDGVALLGAGPTAASPACNGEDLTDCNNEPAGLAYSTTVNRPQHGPYAFAGWRDVLRVLYAGISTDPNDTGCGSELRQTLANNWGNVFQTQCAGGNCTQISHIFRPDDASPVAEVFAALLGLPTPSSASSVEGFGSSPYCNALNWDTSAANASCALGPHRQWTGPGGVPDTTAADGIHQRPPPGTWGDAPDPSQSPFGADVLPTSYQDNDPLRRPCLGAGRLSATPNASAEEVCNLDGALGLLLAVPAVDFVVAQNPLANPFPTSVCTSFIAGSPEAVFTCPSTGAMHSACPDGAALANGTCQIPVDATGNSSCENDPSQWPSPVDAIVHDGRIFNTVLFNGTGYVQATIQTAAGTGPNQVLDFAGHWGRIHSQYVVVDPANPANTGLPCQQVDPSNQIGCLVQADPCSLGIGSTGALSWNGFFGSNTAALKVNQVLPMPQCVQGLNYPLWHKVYANYVFGTGNLSGALLSLSQCTENADIVNTALIDNGLTPLSSGAPYCEDFNEQSLCGQTTNVDGCNLQACTVLTPSQTTCGNGVVETLEECDNGPANVNGGPPGSCSLICRIN